MAITTMLQLIKYPGDGVEGTVHVIALPHPMRRERREGFLPSGFTIKEIIAQAEFEEFTYANLAVFLDGVRVNREDWEEIIPIPGSELIIRFVPRDPVTLFFFFAVFAATLVDSLIVAIAFGVIATIGFYVGVGYLLNLAANALFATDPSKISSGDGEKSHTLRGTRNQILLNEPVWNVYGEFRITPPLAARPFTFIRGKNQFLRMLFAVSYGPIDFIEMRIGETPLGYFAGASVSTFDGDPNSTPPGNYPNIVEDTLSFNMEDQLGGSPEGGGFFEHSLTATATTIVLEFLFPNGVWRVNELGKSRIWQVDMSVEYKLSSGGGWFNALSAPGLSIISSGLTGKNQGSRIRVEGHLKDAFFLTVSFNPAQGEDFYDLRVKTYQIAPNFAYGPNEGQFSGDAQWYAAKAEKNTVGLNFPAGLATIDLTIQASDQLNGVVEQFNCIVQRHIRRYIIGSGWTGYSLTEYRNPAWVALDVIAGKANRTPLSDAEIDFQSFVDLADRCNEVIDFPLGATDVRHTFDGVFDFDTTVVAALRDVLATGRSSLNVVDGKYSVVQDVQKTAPVQHFTPRNILNFRASRRFEDVPDGIKVDFMDSSSGYERNERVVYNDGFSEVDADTGSISFTILTSPSRFQRNDGGNFIADGFVADGFVTVEGSVNPTNNGMKVVAAVSTSILTIEGSLIPETFTGRISTTGAVTFERLSMFGKTRPEEVWKEGRFTFAQGKLRPEVYEFETDWEYLVATRGDLVQVSHDVPLWGLGWGRIVALQYFSAGIINAVQLDEQAGGINPASGDSYVLRLRCVKPDGTTNSLVRNVDKTATAIVRAANDGDVRWIGLGGNTIDETAEGAAIGNLVQFGKLGIESQDLIITKIVPAAEFRARITCIDHGAGLPGQIPLWDIDDEGIPPFDAGITIAEPIERIEPAIPILLIIDSDDDQIADKPVIRYEARGTRDDGSLLLFVTIQIRPGSGARVVTTYFEGQWKTRAEDESEESEWINLGQIPVGVGQFTFGPLPVNNNFDFRVRAVGPHGQVSQYVAITNNAAIASSPIPEVSVSQITDVRPEGVFIGLRVSWFVDQSTGGAVAYVVRWRLGETPFFEIQLGLQTSYDIQLARFGTYTIEVQSIGLDGSLSAPGTVVYEFSPEPAFTKIKVSGLELENQANALQFTGQHAKFIWRISSSLLNSELGQELFGTDTGEGAGINGLFRDYELRVVHPDNNRIIRTEFTTNNFYVYDYEKNLEDQRKFTGTSGAVAIRRFRFEVYMRDRYGRLSLPAAIVVNNPAPDAPTSLELTAKSQFIVAKAEGGIRDNDEAGILFWAKTSPGINIVVDPPVVDLPNTDQAVIPAASSTTYYVVAARYDKFNKNPADLNPSSEVSVATLSPEGLTDEELSQIGGFFRNGFEGPEFSAWQVGGGTLLSSDATSHSGLEAGRFSHSGASPGSGHTANGGWLSLPTKTSTDFSGKRVRVGMYVRGVISGSTEMAVSYSPGGGLADSGWQTSTDLIGSLDTGSWKFLSFFYQIPEAQGEITSRIKIWADTSNSGLAVLVDGVSVSAFLDQITAANVDVHIGSAAIGNAQVGELSALKITTDTLNADRIGTKTLLAEKIIVGSFDNLVWDPGFEEDAATYPAISNKTWHTVDGGGTWSRITSGDRAGGVRSGQFAAMYEANGQTGTAQILVQGDPTTGPAGMIGAAKGDKFHFQFYVKANTATPTVETTDTLNIVTTPPLRITRGSGSFVTDGWEIGMALKAENFNVYGNNQDYIVADVQALTLEVDKANPTSDIDPIDETGTGGQTLRQMTIQPFIDFYGNGPALLQSKAGPLMVPDTSFQPVDMALGFADSAPADALFGVYGVNVYKSPSATEYYFDDFSVRKVVPTFVIEPGATSNLSQLERFPLIEGSEVLFDGSGTDGEVWTEVEKHTASVFGLAPVFLSIQAFIRIDQIFGDIEAQQAPMAGGPQAFFRVIRYPAAAPPPADVTGRFKDNIDGTDADLYGLYEIYRPDQPIMMSTTGYWPGAVVTKFELPDPGNWTWEIQAKWIPFDYRVGLVSRSGTTPTLLAGVVDPGTGLIPKWMSFVDPANYAEAARGGSADIAYVHNIFIDNTSLGPVDFDVNRVYNQELLGINGNLTSYTITNSPYHISCIDEKPAIVKTYVYIQIYEAIR